MHLFSDGYKAWQMARLMQVQQCWQ